MALNGVGAAGGYVGREEFEAFKEQTQRDLHVAEGRCLKELSSTGKQTDKLEKDLGESRQRLEKLEKSPRLPNWAKIALPISGISAVAALGLAAYEGMKGANSSTNYVA